VEGSESDPLSGVCVCVCQCGYIELTLRLHIRSHSLEAHQRPLTCEVTTPAAGPVLFCDPAVMMAVMLLTLVFDKGSL